MTVIAVQGALIYQMDHSCSRSTADYREVTNANSHTTSHVYFNA